MIARHRLLWLPGITLLLSGCIDASMARPGRMLVDPLPSLIDALVATDRFGAPLVALCGLTALAYLPARILVGHRGERALSMSLAPGIALGLATLGWWLAGFVSGSMATVVLSIGAAGIGVAAIGRARRIARPAPQSSPGATVWLSLIWLLSLGVRLAVVRDLALPAWVDGVHHTYLTDLLRQAGTVPNDYGVLLPFGPFAYHFGFHALTATVAELSGTDSASSVIVVGQFLSAAAAPTAYAITRLGGGTQRAGLVAAAVVGLVSVFPAYFVSWSRFTQLAGMVAAAPWLMLAARAAENRTTAVAGGFGLLILAMIHPRVAVMAAIAAVTLNVLPRQSVESAGTRGGLRLLGTALAGLAGLALGATWLWRVGGGLVPRLDAGRAMTEAVNQFEIAVLSTSYDPYLYGLAVATMLYLVLRGNRVASATGIWLIVTGLVALGSRLGLPFGNLIGGGAFAIALWLPAAVLVGVAVDAGMALVARGQVRLRRIPVAVCVVAMLALSEPSLKALNSDTVLASPRDREALDQLARYIGPDEIVAVSVREWQLGTYRGADAGYWIGVIGAGRSVVPPGLYGLGPVAWATDLSGRLAAWESAAQRSDTIASGMRAFGARWLFIGARDADFHRVAAESSDDLRLEADFAGPRLYRLRDDRP
jgi:hypothetical protein